jgi:hypothetical protein
MKFSTAISSILFSFVLLGCDSQQVMKKPAAAAMQIQPQLQKNAVNVVPIKAEEVEVSKNKCLKGKYIHCHLIEIKMDSFKDQKINQFLLDSFFDEKLGKKSVQEALNNAASKWMKDIIPDLNDRAKDDDMDRLPEDKTYSKMKIRLVKATSDFLYFNTIQDVYIGGVHDEYESDNIVMDRKSYRAIKLKNMLIPGTEDNLLRLQKKYIVKALKDDPDETSTEQQLKDMLERYDPKPELSDNWGFDKEHMIFTYSPYEVAAFAFGIIDAQIPFKELKGIIKPEYLDRLKRKNSQK